MWTTKKRQIIDRSKQASLNISKDSKKVCSLYVSVMILQTSLDFNFDLFQFRYNFMTKGFSNYMTRFCNLNLDIISFK